MADEDDLDDDNLLEGEGLEDEYIAPLVGDPDEVVEAVMEEAFNAAMPAIEALLNTLGDLDSVYAREMKGNTEPLDNWLSLQMSVLLYGYVAYRAGMLELEDLNPKDGQPSPIDTVKADFARIVGEDAVRQIMGILIDEADIAIEARITETQGFLPEGNA